MHLENYLSQNSPTVFTDDPYFPCSRQGGTVITVSISVVTYFPEQAEFEQVIAHLVAAVREARNSLGGTLGEVSLTVIDNSCESAVFDTVRRCLKNHEGEFGGHVRAINSSANVGFGAGHNVAIAKEESTYHLVLNPDVLMEPDALKRAICFMQDNRDIGLLAPRVLGADGMPSYLCKRYPSVLDLVLRGFAPGWVQRRFRKRLDHYEMRDVTHCENVMNIPIASGCFMLLRTDVLKRLGGFDERYFLYFEDYDMCMRMNGIAGIAYVPSICITHSGGNAARKGGRHIAMFVTSAARFFSRWGWKWW
jgi:GT2 family glycosyltransferase